MQYVRIEDDGDGGSRTSDVVVPLQHVPYTVGVPPLWVSSPIPANELVFVRFPDEIQRTNPHPAPRRQFGVVMGGVGETETSDGEIRQFRPGAVVLLEDVQGRGHVTRVVEPPFTIMFVPLADGALPI